MFGANFDCLEFFYKNVWKRIKTVENVCKTFRLSFFVLLSHSV